MTDVSVHCFEVNTFLERQVITIRFFKDFGTVPRKIWSFDYQLLNANLYTGLNFSQKSKIYWKAVQFK